MCKRMRYVEPDRVLFIIFFKQEEVGKLDGLLKVYLISISFQITESNIFFHQ